MALPITARVGIYASILNPTTLNIATCFNLCILLRPPESFLMFHIVWVIQSSKVKSNIKQKLVNQATLL